MQPSKYMQIIFEHFRQAGRFDPVRDWFMLLTFFGVMLVGILAWNTWAFETVIDGGSIGSVAPVTAPTTFDSGELDKVRSIIETRATEEAKYKNGEYHFADPSQ